MSNGDTGAFNDKPMLAADDSCPNSSEAVLQANGP